VDGAILFGVPIHFGRETVEVMKVIVDDLKLRVLKR
jgi:hypothetical protein